jgi:hypothetical protein
MFQGLTNSGSLLARFESAVSVVPRETEVLRTGQNVTRSQVKRGVVLGASQTRKPETRFAQVQVRKFQSEVADCVSRETWREPDRNADDGPTTDDFTAKLLRLCCSARRPLFHHPEGRIVLGARSRPPNWRRTYLTLEGLQTLYRLLKFLFGGCASDVSRETRRDPIQIANADDGVTTDDLTAKLL